MGKVQLCNSLHPVFTISKTSELSLEKWAPENALEQYIVLKLE